MRGSSPATPSIARVAGLTLTILLLGTLRTATARGDDGTNPPAPVPAPAPESAAEEDRQEQIDRHVQKGWKAFRGGNHEEALTRMERLAKVDPANPLPKYLTARVYARTGKYAEALALATAGAAEHPDDRATEVLRFDLLLRLGRDDAASTAATAAIATRPGDLVAKDVQGTLLEAKGRRKEALAAYDAVIAAYNERDPLPEELTSVAHAALRATRLSTNPQDDLVRAAAKVLKRRIDQEPEDVDALLAYADLFQANRGPQGQQTAGKGYAEILKKNPNVPEARVGQARVQLVYYAQDRAVQECERALVTNPSFVPAMNLLASIRVGDGDYEKADALWTKASAVNPKDLEARAIHAARVFIGGDKAAFAAIEKEVLAENPTYGAFYRIAAELVGERQRRFDVAAELCEKAIEKDPLDDQAYVVQAVNYMNLGREDEARRRFDQAVEVSKRYRDVVRDNFTEVLDVLKTFVTTTSKNFVLKQHPEESAVMEVYLLPLLERAWTDLSAKYGFTPTGPVLVESFHRHDDFSARSVGAPSIPALGVCFGKVITLDGPLSREVGEFSWARTAWHEFAHVVTLQLSKGQVPRWLTEGLSVHEEHAHDPTWARDEMDRDLYDRWKNGRLLKMSEINHAFHGPDVMFAYFQGGLIADYLKEKRGFEAVTKMLRRYADDVPTEKLFPEILGVPLAKFDEEFSAWVGTRVSGWKLEPRWDDDSKKAFEERTKKDPKDAEAWIRLAWAHFQRGNGIDAGAALDTAKSLTPDAPEVVLLQGSLAARGERKDVAKERYEAYLAAGNDDLAARLWLAKNALEGGKDSEAAVKHFEAAKACFPSLVGAGSPYLSLAKLYTGAGKPEKAVLELEGYARIAHEDYEVRKKLAAWYVDKKDDVALMRVSDEMIQISPFGADRGKAPDLDLHVRYAGALERAGKKEEAAREWRVQTLLIDVLPEEARAKAGGVEARLKLGVLYLELKRADEALEQALAALALDPQSVPAVSLKERALEAGAGK